MLIVLISEKKRFVHLVKVGFHVRDMCCSFQIRFSLNWLNIQDLVPIFLIFSLTIRLWQHEVSGNFIIDVLTLLAMRGPFQPPSPVGKSQFLQNQTFVESQTSL